MARKHEDLTDEEVYLRPRPSKARWVAIAAAMVAAFAVVYALLAWSR